MKTWWRMLIGGLLLAVSASAADAPGGLVYVIPIRGPIEPALLYVIRRGVAEAERNNADAVVFVMDTPGGTVNAARDIIHVIQNIQAPTYTFVEKDAFSAGAIIALATRHIYMAPGSVIGDALPIMISPIGGVQEMPESVEEKSVSAVAALIRSAAEQGGHNKEVAEAMVRRELELVIDDQVISPAGHLLTLTNEEAEARYGDDAIPLLSSGTVRTVEDLLDRIGMRDAEVRTLRVSAAERIARFIAAIGPMLMMLGLLGIYMEIRTPGFGLPGILVLIALAIFFWGHHVAGMAGSEDLLLVIIGLALLIVELLFIPDFGLVGVLGLLMMLAGFLMAMVYRYPGAPVLPNFSELQWPLVKLTGALLGTLVGAALMGRWLPRSPVFRRLMLSASTGRAEGYIASDDRSALIGTEGKALTSLRPAGAAMLAGRRCDVVTPGDFVDAGHRVRVVDAHGGRLVVEPVVTREQEGSSA